MDTAELKSRTKQFAIRIIRVVESLPKTISGRTIGNQLIRSGTSVAANYRAACRARSQNEFIAKVGIVIEESDESVFWLEMIIETKLLKESLVQSILKEANELTAIMVASSNSAQRNKKKT